MNYSGLSISSGFNKYNRRAGRILALLLVLSVSYWYCLPVVTQSIIAYSEFRGYDFLLFALGLMLITKYRRNLAVFFRHDAPGRWLFRFAILATLTYPFTAIWSVAISKSVWALVTAIYLFHLWGYLLAYAAFRIFVRTRRHAFLLLDMFLLVGTIEAVIIILQGLGWVPRFWSPLYEVYGPRAFSATLGPNRTLPGHAMVLVFAVAVTYWRNLPAVGTRRSWLALLAGISSVAALGITGSRTAWVVFLVFVAVSLVKGKHKFALTIFIVVIATSILLLTPISLREAIEETYEWRIAQPLQYAPDDPISKFQAIDAGRLGKWLTSIRKIAQRPWLIPLGVGFNNRWILTGGNSPHNMYLTLIAELGVVGLYLYLKWLSAIWRQTSRLMTFGERLSGSREKMVLPTEMQPLLTAIMVSLLAGEILYIYRPSFAFTGMFLFLCAMMNNPVLVFSEKGIELMKNKSVSINTAGSRL